MTSSELIELHREVTELRKRLRVTCSALYAANHDVERALGRAVLEEGVYAK